MLRRVVIGAAFVCLLGVPAFAADTPKDSDECSDRLAGADEALQTKINNMSEDETEKVNDLLNEVDAQCSSGDLAQAGKTLTTVNGLLSKVK